MKPNLLPNLWALMVPLLLVTPYPRPARAMERQSFYIVESCNPALFPKSKVTRSQITNVVDALRRAIKTYRGMEFVLTRSGLKLNEATHVASVGFSYAAANALYHLLGGAAAGLTPIQASYHDRLLKDVAPETEGRAAHWWIQDADGSIIDPTFDQFTERGSNPPYKEGVPRSFGVKKDKPFANALPLIRAVTKDLAARGFRRDGRVKPGFIEAKTKWGRALAYPRARYRAARAVVESSRVGQIQMTEESIHSVMRVLLNSESDGVLGMDRMFDQYFSRSLFGKTGLTPERLLDKRVLDLGAGLSNFVDLAVTKAQAREAIGTDLIFNPIFKETSSVLFNTTALDLSRRVGASHTNLPFENGTFDIIVSSWSFYFLTTIPDAKLKAYEEVLRVLASEGTAYIYEMGKPQPAFEDNLRSLVESYGATLDGIPAIEEPKDREEFQHRVIVIHKPKAVR